MSVISAAQFRDQLDRWGVDYIEHSRHDRCLSRTVDWSDHVARRGRDCARRGWSAHGIAIHHSGGPTSWQFVWDGKTGVPGPLYTVLIYPDGVAHLTGWRITNNVGSCDKTVRDRVLRAEMPTSGGNVRPGADDYFAANSEFYGISYRGTAPNSAQRKTALLICAAICSAHGPGWDGASVAGHKELTRRKPDPEGENMSDFRSDLNTLLKQGPGGNMAVYNDVWRTDDKARAPKGRETDTNKFWWTESILEFIGDFASWFRYNQSTKPEFADENDWTLGSFIRYGYTHSRTGRDAARDARDEAVKNGQKLDAILDAVGGADAAEIKDHIDQRHAEAAQQRQAIADTMTAKLDAIVDATQGSDPAEAKLAAILEILGVDA